jgi:2-(3-amino-3-carboxypropyl)histidine synthase
MNRNNDSEYDLDIEEVIETINENGYLRVLIQLPEGLKGMSKDIQEDIERNTAAMVVIYAEPCFGACDLPLGINALNFNLLVHFGHAPFPNLKYCIPTMYMEAKSNIDVLSVIKRSTPHLKEKVGLITTIQHLHKIEEAKSFLTDMDFIVKIGEGKGRVDHPGQVLGCDISSALSIADDVDCFLYFGSGNFHALGVALATKKPVIIADPYLDEIRDVEEEKERLLRQRHGAITKAKDAESFGIIVSTKPGQARMRVAIKLSETIEKHHKKAQILLVNHVDAGRIQTYNVQALVVTACPRIAIDDYMLYSIPILTPTELKIILGEQKWEDYTFDFLI